jgi:hypothetical protein
MANSVIRFRNNKRCCPEADERWKPECAGLADLEKAFRSSRPALVFDVPRADIFPCCDHRVP